MIITLYLLPRTHENLDVEFTDDDGNKTFQRRDEIKVATCSTLRGLAVDPESSTRKPVSSDCGMH
jgi:hypothetical protein